MRFLRATAHTPFQPTKPMQRHSLDNNKGSRAVSQNTMGNSKDKARR